MTPGTTVRLVEYDDTPFGTVSKYNEKTRRYTIAVKCGANRTKDICVLGHHFQKVATKWMERHNSKCEICSEGGKLVLCEYCNVAVHSLCMDPPLDHPPKSEWICDACCCADVYPHIAAV